MKKLLIALVIMATFGIGATAHADYHFINGQWVYDSSEDQQREQPRIQQLEDQQRKQQQENEQMKEQNRRDKEEQQTQQQLRDYQQQQNGGR